MPVFAVPTRHRPPSTGRTRVKHLGALLAAFFVLALVPFLQMRASSPVNLLSAASHSIEASASGELGWEAQGNTSISRSPDRAYVGKSSLKVVVAKAGYVDSSRTARVGTSLVRTNPGTTYKGLVRVSARPGETSPMRCEIRWYDVNRNILSTYEDAPLVRDRSDRWTQPSCEAKAPTGARFMALRVYISEAEYGDVHFIDDAWLIGGVTTTPAAPNTFARRISAASSNDLVAPDGTKFVADTGFVGGSGTGNIGSNIAKTDNDSLYVKHRWGMSGYSVPVPAAGSYTVRLHFAETAFTTKGRRVFDVSIEGKVRQNDLDVFAVAGADTALIRQFDVIVSDLKVDIGFTAVVEDPMISGIEVLGTSTNANTGPATPPDQPAPTTTAPPAPTTTAPPAPTTTTPPPPATTPAGGFPNASNTGPSGTLKPSGSITTSANGQVIENLDINGSVRVAHDNVTIRNVRIRSNGQAISIVGNTGLLVEDCELDGNSAAPDSAIGEHNYTMRRCDIHHHGEGPRINGDVVLEDNYLHDFANFHSVDAHQDCIQVTSGSRIIIRHNTCMLQIDPGNATIMIGSYDGSDILIEGNLLAGGGWSVYCGAHTGYTNVSVINNRFSTVYYPNSGFHGPLVYCTNGPVSGNVWHDGPNAGKPI